MKFKLVLSLVIVGAVALCSTAFAAAPAKAKKSAVVKKVIIKPVPKARTVVRSKLNMVAKTTLEATANPLSLEAKASSLTNEAVVVKKAIVLKDLTKKDPAYPYVTKMVNVYQVISGYPDQTFKGKKTISRAEFCKVMAASMAYLEKAYQFPMVNEPATKEAAFKDLKKTNWAYPSVVELVAKYKIFTGYPDGTFKPNKTISKYEMATVMGKALKVVFDRCEISLEAKTESKFVDVKPKHWAAKFLDVLVSYRILDDKQQSAQKSKYLAFLGNKPVDRFTVAIMGSKLLDTIVAEIDKLGAEKLAILRNKYGIMTSKPAKPAPKEAMVIQKQMTLGEPKAYVSGAVGNIMESASSTNNWMGFAGAASIGNAFNTFGLHGDYELTGKYSFNQIIYLVPGGGGGVSGGTVYENRFDVDLNTIYPIVDFYGYKGLLLLGGKYSNMMNQLSPTSFMALNAGVATVVPLFGRNMLGRVFYSILPTPAKSTSSLGAPSSLLNYEVGVDFEVFKTPCIAGYSGETMFINGGTFTRFYNMFFLRYFL